MIPDSAIRNLIREKIRSKYKDILEGSDPGVGTDSEADLLSAISGQNKPKVGKLDDDNTGDDDTGDDDTDPSSSRKKKPAMPKQIIKKMEDELAAAADDNAKIEIYARYKETYRLPDNHEKAYQDLLKNQSEPDPSDDPAVKRKKSYQLAYREAIKAVKEKMPNYRLESFNDSSSCKTAIKKIMIDIITDRDKAYSKFRDTVGRFSVMDAEITAEIRNDPKNTKLGPIQAGLSKKEKSNILKNGLFDMISFLLKDPNALDEICDLEEKCDTTTVSGKNFISHYINTSDVSVINDFKENIDDSLTAGRGGNYKRISALIRMFFIPKSDSPGFKEVYAASDKGEFTPSTDIIVAGEDRPIVPIWNKNVDSLKKEIKYLVEHMDYQNINIDDVKKMQETLLSLANKDTSDLILTRMSIMAACGSRSSFQDTAKSTEDPGSPESLRGAVTYSGDEAKFDSDRLKRNGVLIYKAVEEQVNSTDGYLASGEEGMLELPTLMGTYMTYFGSGAITSFITGDYTEDAHESLAIMIAYLIYPISRDKFIRGITGKLSESEYETIIGLVTNSGKNPDVFGLVNLPDAAAMKASLEGTFAGRGDITIEESVNYSDDKIKIKKVGQKYLIEEKQLKVLTKFLKKQKRRGNK